MGDYVLVDTSGAIINNIVLDDDAEWSPPEGILPVGNGEGQYAIGGTLIDDIYTPPVAEIVPPPILSVPTTAT